MSSGWKDIIGKLEKLKVTSRMIRDRLFKEAEGNVALHVSRPRPTRTPISLSGRGELQLAILIETMRREGFELGVSRPKVVFKKDEETGKLLEPIEEVVINVDEEHSGVVVQKMSERKAEMVEMRPSGGGRLRLVFYCPHARPHRLSGRTFDRHARHGDHEPPVPFVFRVQGRHPGRRNGVLIANKRRGVAYAMWNLEDRGPMMIEPGWKVYQGMIIGRRARENDLEVNVLKEKKLTNIRAAGKDEAVKLTPPIRMTLEKALAYIEDDELVEVTPKSIRLRKTRLDPNERKQAERAKEAAVGWRGQGSAGC